MVGFTVALTPGLPVLLGEEEAREADKVRQALGPSARKNGMGEASVPPAYRRDFANIGLDGYAWQLWGLQRIWAYALQLYEYFRHLLHRMCLKCNDAVSNYGSAFATCRTAQ